MTETPTVRECVRLSPEALRLLERQLPPPDIPPGNSNALYAGQLIGIQKVLKLLREGFST